MGEVISLWLHFLMKEGGMTKEQAQRYFVYIDSKFIHKRAVYERGSLVGQVT